MSLIKIINAGKKYDDRWVVRNVSLDVNAGETCVLLGPSGSGKSTLLKMVNRLVEPDEGEILFNNKLVTEYNPIELRRQIGYVVQSIGLFPHLTVEENISILLKHLGWKKSEIKERVEYLLNFIGLEPSIYRRKYPSQLSGGEAQRVGVARALSADPPVLLMDEPFGALDPVTRRRLQDEFALLKEKLNKTIIFVTHDVYEAVILADRIALIREGKLIQYADPLTLYQNPASDFVEKFLGIEFGFHVLSRFSVSDVPRESTDTDTDLPVASEDMTLKEAIAEMIRQRKGALRVNGRGDKTEVITFDSILSFIQGKERT